MVSRSADEGRRLMPTAARIARFEAKTIPEPNTGCLLWTGGINEHGYGVFWNGERLEKAHRFALRAAGVEVPTDLDVRHTCDTPGCVEAQHLVVGTTLENVADMWLRRRAAVQHRRGTMQVGAKLDDAKALQIRVMYAFQEANQYELAERYGVSQRTIWNVVNGRLWRHESGLVVRKGCGR